MHQTKAAHGAHTHRRGRAWFNQGQLMDSDHLDRERNTALLIRACWDTLPQEPRPDQLHGLCKLTWITVGTGGDAAADTTRSVVAPALSAILSVGLSAKNRDQLAQELQAQGVPTALARLATKNIGFVNFYNAYRNLSRGWIAEHQALITKLFRDASNMSADSDARSLYSAIEKMPPIQNRAAALPPVNLLSPVVACLDPRSRSPIINGRAGVRRNLRRLNLSRATLPEQFDGLVGLINQAGIADAFVLDCADKADLERALALPGTRPAHSNNTKGGGLPRPLSDRDTLEIETLRRTLTATQTRLHNKMTNALKVICAASQLRVAEATDPECKFDALIYGYRATERNLLVEAKSSDDPAVCRLAVGQLLDYRRLLPECAATDIAVLFPKQPRRHAQEFLRYVGVKMLWFGPNLDVIEGDVTFEPAET